MPSTDPNTTLKISGPVDLISGVPYLLGFKPENSLVLVGLAHSALVVTARVDLDGITMSTVTDIIEAMIRGGVRDFITVVYSDTYPEQYGTLIDDVVVVMADRDVLMLDALYVTDGIWASYLCSDPACCPPGTHQLPSAPTAFETAATVAGMTVARNRDALTERLAPMRGRERLLEQLVAAEALLGRPLVNGSLSRARVSVGALLVELDKTIEYGLMPVTNTELIDLVVVLRQIPIRDEVWAAVDERKGKGAELWQDLARRLPSPYDATPLFLYAWSIWRRGNGAMAGIAASRAVMSDPNCTAADLLLAAINAGIDPRTFPGLSIADPPDHARVAPAKEVP